jgi:quinoprotein glucose dehydrogenase
LRAGKKVRLETRTLVRKLVLEHGTSRVSHAVAVQRDRPRDTLEVHAKQFVVAGGYAWSAHLLLLSAQPGAPNGLANRSGVVGKYLAGHRNVQAFMALPITLYPGINEQHSLVTKQFMRVRPADTDGKYVRHDLRVWESAAGRGARLTNDSGALMLGDEILRDWRARTKTGVARVRAYYDVIPDRSSALALDMSRRNEWGDPLPRLSFRDDPASAALRPFTEQRIRDLFTRMARSGGGTVTRTNVDEFQDHPAGGCRMGDDPATSVVDSHGRSHDHENLWVVGAPTSVSGGCANATLTFCALALRSAARLVGELG